MEENNCDNKMYFPKDYLSEELKELLLELKIVEEITIPEKYFNKISEEKFVNVVANEFQIPCKFASINTDNETFNSWTIDLLKILNTDKEDLSSLYPLIDVIVFDKFLSTFPNNIDMCKNAFKKIPNFNIYNMPVLDMNEEYHQVNEAFLYNVPEQAIQYRDGMNKHYILNKKYWSNKAYLETLKCNNFYQITPNDLKFSGDSYEKKYPLEFWKWVYLYKNDQDFSKVLYTMLIDGLLNDREKETYSGQHRKEAQKFLLDIVVKEQDVINERECQIKIDGEIFVEYIEVIDNINSNSDSKLGISPNHVVNEKNIEVIVKEVEKEIRFDNRYEEIRGWINNIKIINHSSKEKLFARLKGNELILTKQDNRRKYRENISQFLKESYDINIEKREYKMTSIDNSQCYKVQVCDQTTFDLLLDNEIMNFDSLKDEKKFFMEPLLFHNKYLQGYGKKCPFCKTKVITQVTTMRVKDIYFEDIKLSFFCCSNCADLFEYSSGDPLIYINNELVEKDLISIKKDDIYKKLKLVNSTIRLEFNLESEFVNDIHSIEFIPKAAHRYVLCNEVLSNKLK